MIYRKPLSHEQVVHPCGETLSEGHKLWRVKAVTPFMRAGVLLAPEYAALKSSCDPLFPVSKLIKCKLSTK